MPPVRLQKILAAAGVASRRASETLIAQGRVTVNGVVASELGTKADPDHDDVRVDGRRVRPADRRRHLLLNKPRNVVCTRSDPQGRTTVIDLIRGVRDYVYPVGRLDYDSEGLLLLTNDGELAARLTHPRHEILKRYLVEVAGVPTQDALARLARGVVLDGERTGPARVRLVKSFAASSRAAGAVIEIGIREGRNRQVRRMCEAVGHAIVRLERVAIGPLADRELRPGQWRDLTAAELRALRKATGLDE